MMRKLVDNIRRFISFYFCIIVNFSTNEINSTFSDQLFNFKQYYQTFKNNFSVKWEEQ